MRDEKFYWRQQIFHFSLFTFHYLLYLCSKFCQKMKEIAKSWGLWTVAVGLVAIGLLCFESDMLWKVQQQNLFLYTPLFFKQQMVVSGGLLAYVSAFFTQFLFHPWLGVLMLCGWWLLLAWLLSRTFRLGPLRPALALTPVAMLVIANMDMGYWIYVVKLRGWFFSATIGTTAVTALLWGFRCLTHRGPALRAAYILLTAAVGYPLMGCYALAAALLMGCWTWRLKKDHGVNALLSLTALVATVAIPLICYRYVYYQTSLTNIWWTGLPIFTLREDYPKFYTPYAVLAKYFLLLVLTYRHDFKPKKVMWVRIRQGLLAAVLAVLVYHFWYKDENFHHELAMQHAIERTDWQGVLEEGARQQDEPTRAIVMMHNLALSRLGRQCDEMYNFPKGSKKSKAPFDIYMHQVAGRLVYYQYGLMNECHRMCMENGVEYGWSVELLQYMARTAMFCGETTAARKYLDLLRETQYYGPWADNIEPLLYNENLRARARETGPITHMLHYDNRLGSDNGYVEKYLMTLLAKIDADDPYFQEQAVLGALWLRDPDLFWERFTHYLELFPNGPVPRIFQEAACLFGNMQQKEFLHQLPFGKGIQESYQAFMQQARQREGQPTEQVRNALYPSFGSTYYFEYFFLKNLTYY